MNNFHWTAWLILVAITATVTTQTARVWTGKTSRKYVEGRNSEESMNELLRRFVRSNVANSGGFISVVIASISNHEADSLKNQFVRVFLRSVFYLSCTSFALFVIASIAIVLSGRPEFLVPPPLRQGLSGKKETKD